MKIVYLDNNIILKLTDSPQSWTGFYDCLCKDFGQTFKVISSYYSFLEYIGFKKNELDIKENRTIVNKHPENISLFLEEFYCNTKKQIHNQLSSESVQNYLSHLIKTKKFYSSTFATSQDLINSLFENIISDFYYNRSQFIDLASEYLAWDHYCNFMPIGISEHIIRQIQLGHWLQYYEKGILLPFGKIIDDLTEQKSLDKNTKFSGNGDMVDSEGITYSVIGYLHNDELRQVNFLTTDKIINLEERIDLARNVLIELENTLKKPINKSSGSIYRINFSNNSTFIDKILYTSPIIHL